MATVDLSQLPAPDVVEALDYETLPGECEAIPISLYAEDLQEVAAMCVSKRYAHFTPHHPE